MYALSRIDCFQKRGSIWAGSVRQTWHSATVEQNRFQAKSKPIYYLMELVFTNIISKYLRYLF